MSKYESITKFIAPLSIEESGKWVVDLDHEGTVDDPIPIPWVDHSNCERDFIRAFDDFADHHYHDTLERYGIEWGTESMKSFDVSKVDEDCIIALITGAIRADHFCEGALLNFIEEGYIARWLERLKELDD